MALVRWAVLCGLVAGLARAQFSPGPLSKAHSSLNGPTHCTACHSIGAGTKKFKCLACHTEIRRRLAEGRGLHATLVKQIGDQSTCVHCHSEHNGEVFVPIRWDVDLDKFDHRQAGYPLEGGHQGLACQKCHSPEHIPAAERSQVKIKDLRRTYLGLTRGCVPCHADEHHGQLPDCQRCHAFVKWKPAGGFEHTKARFQLSGAHQRVACSKCHAREEGPKPFVKYTGIAFSSCAPCHSDPHRGAFTAPCESCHNDVSWKQQVRTAQVFDHSRTHFPLEGKHATVGCEKCHRSSNFKEPVAHDKCVSCHTKDPHSGQFLARAGGIECAGCHTVQGWKPTTFVAARHAETHYPLGGRHAAVACGKCHIPKGAETVYKVRFERCTDCHEDIHRAQFRDEPYGNRCEECHTVGGFRPSTFSLARHRKSGYPLEGAHTAVACGECHSEKEAGHPQPAHPVAGRFRYADRSCTACHQDPHQGQFRERMAAAQAGGAAGCPSCHSMRSWKDLTRFDHATTRFGLAGTHRGVGCGECHRPAQASLGIRSVVYKAAPQACGGCHEDVHGGQFTGLAASGGCARCHGVSKWKPTKFDHDRDSTFKLAGAHSEVRCERCHTTRQELKGKTVLVYRATPRECSSCHGPNIARN